MRIKNTLITILLCLVCLSGCIRDPQQLPSSEVKPSETEIKAIFELSTMKCYYNNVAKFLEEDAEGILFWKKDRHFWVEYSGIVTLGIDVSKVTMNINENTITIGIPKAEILGRKVDETSLTKKSFLYADNSAKGKVEYERFALGKAQSDMLEIAKNNTTLLNNAQQRAKKLIEDYVKNFGKLNGVEYTIHWKDIK